MTVLTATQAGAAAPVPPSQPMELRVSAIRWLTPQSHEIELTAPGGADLPAPTPGAHIDLNLPGGLSRSYSLVNAPGDTARYLIAVTRVADSRGGSAYVVDELRVGEMIEVEGPRNSFPLVDADRVVFFAGGIGITPILSMIRARAQAGLPWELHYAVRNRAAAAYLAELQGLARAPGCILNLHDDAAEGTVMAIADSVACVPAGAHLYCCGPAPMLESFEAGAADRPRDQVHVEYFSNEVEASTTGFSVFLKRKGLELDVPPGRTIMEVLKEAGVRVAYSCQEGVCGTCETRVLDGVPDHKDRVLSDREQASNKVMMICCSGAKTDRLVLDI